MSENVQLPVPVDREGSFQAEIIEYRVVDAESGAVGIGLKARLTAWWLHDEEKWDDWTSFNVEAEGCSWVVLKSGAVNDKSVEALCKYAGWDGNLDSVADGSWKPTPFQVAVKQEEYKGKKSYKIAFVNGFDSTPGAGTISPERAKELAGKHGAALRAVAASVRRNTAPATGTAPAAPPKSKAAPKQAVMAHNTTEGDSIPF